MATQQSPLPYVGVLTEITSYNMARGYVIVTQGDTGIVTYGNLALIEDTEDPNRKYLATVVDVREKGVLPSVDQKAFTEILQALQAARPVNFKSVVEALRELVFPGVHRQYGLREVDLRILGELRKDQLTNRYMLDSHKRPPRPYSIVLEADPGIVEDLVAYDCGFLAIGRHYVINDALVTLNPAKLNMHLAIVGQTGSGKTETVKRVAIEFLARVKGEKTLIVLDVHGEYLGYPYKPPAAGGRRPVPLYEAALDPASYVFEPRSKCSGMNPIPPGKTTIIVPFNIKIIGLRRRDEILYFNRFKSLVDHLESVLGKHGRNIETVFFGKHDIYSYNKKTGSIVTISLHEAWNKISKGKDLLVSTPVPDALTVDEIDEYTSTRSEYAPLIIMNMADSLGLLDGELVTSVSLLYSIITMYRYLKMTNSKITIAQNKFIKIIENIINNVKNEAARAVAKGIKIDKKTIFFIVRDSILSIIPNPQTSKGGTKKLPKEIWIEPYAWWYLLTLPLWKRWDPQYLAQTSISFPFDVGDPQVLVASLAAPDPENGGRPWEDTLVERVESVVSLLGRTPDQTVASVARALREVSFMVAPPLYYEIYRDLMARVMRKDLSIVLLAPPSTGAIDLPMARLLQAAFGEAVRQYDPAKPKTTLLIAEEAHNLAPADDDPPTKPYMVMIAREGRKWGLGLVIVSQRPGFVDSDVLSQAGTLIALRVTNPDDIAGLRRSVESASKELVERLPDLDVGQALVSGIALPERRIPLIANIEMVVSRQQAAASQSGSQQGQTTSNPTDAKKQ